MVTIIAGMQFGGYVAGRVLGSRQGAVLTGILGGLVSSTAVFLMLAEQARRGTGTSRLAAATALFATAATLVELVAVLFAGSAALATRIAVPAAAMVATGVLIGTLFARDGSNTEESLQTKNPLDLKAAIKLGLVIGVLLIAVASAQRAFGPKGAQMVAMFGGLFELQGVSLATAVLLREGHVALEAAERAIALAILASFLSKFGLVWFLGRRTDFALRVSAGLAAMLAAGAGASMLLRP